MCRDFYAQDIMAEILSYYSKNFPTPPPRENKTVGKIISISDRVPSCEFCEEVSSFMYEIPTYRFMTDSHALFVNFHMYYGFRIECIVFMSDSHTLFKNFHVFRFRP